MANATRRLKYEDYADNLPALLERVDTEHEVSRARARRPGLPDRNVIEDRKRIYPKSTSKCSVERPELSRISMEQALKRDLREMRQQVARPTRLVGLPNRLRPGN